MKSFPQIAFVLFCCLALIRNLATAQQNSYAPVPDRVVTAKTIFLINDSGTAKFGDALYRQLTDWKRWEIVTDRSKADLVVVLTQRDSIAGFISTASATATGASAYGTGVSAPVTSQQWYLHIVDAKTGEKLWTSETAMGGKLWRTWNSIAKSLVSDIQKRIR
jgi:hypothetical protein